ELLARHTQRWRCLCLENDLQVNDACLERVERVVPRDRIGGDSRLTRARSCLEGNAAREGAIVKPRARDRQCLGGAHAPVEVDFVEQLRCFLGAHAQVLLQWAKVTFEASSGRQTTRDRGGNALGVELFAKR